MRATPLLLAGSALAVAIAYYHWTRRRDGADTSPHGSVPPSPHSPQSHVPGRVDALAEPLPGHWVWPAGVWHGRKPEISSGFFTPRSTQAGKRIVHGGVDLMYRRQPGDPWRAGTPNGSAGFVMPDHRAALAASDGVVWSATNQPRGWTVVVDHAPRHFATFYTHLSSLLVEPKQAISAGTPLGVIGADPLDGEHLMHLHFEVWAGGATDRFDPEPVMRRWDYLPDPGDVSSTPRGRWRFEGAPVAAADESRRRRARIRLNNPLAERTDNRDGYPRDPARFVERVGPNGLRQAPRDRFAVCVDSRGDRTGRIRGSARHRRDRLPRDLDDARAQGELTRRIVTARDPGILAPRRAATPTGDHPSAARNYPGRPATRAVRHPVPRHVAVGSGGDRTAISHGHGASSAAAWRRVAVRRTHPQLTELHDV